MLQFRGLLAPKRIELMEAIDFEPRIAPQDLVMVVLIALTHNRPVLITSLHHLRRLEIQIQLIGESLGKAFNPDLCVVTCSPELAWPELETKFSEISGSIMLLRRIEYLSLEVQLQLGYALMQESPILKQFLATSPLIFTSKGLPEKLHPFLRRQILLRQSLDLLSYESPSLVLPDHLKASGISSQTTAIRQNISSITIVPELIRYIKDILLFVRTHRLVRVGIGPQAASDLELLIRTLCVLQGKSFATPLIIKEAARLALPIHVHLCDPGDEPSLQYGGDINLIKVWIKEWDGDVLVDSVLDEVPVPG